MFDLRSLMMSGSRLPLAEAGQHRNRTTTKTVVLRVLAEARTTTDERPTTSSRRWWSKKVVNRPPPPSPRYVVRRAPARSCEGGTDTKTKGVPPRSRRPLRRNAATRTTTTSDFLSPTTITHDQLSLSIVSSSSPRGARRRRCLHACFVVGDLFLLFRFAVVPAASRRPPPAMPRNTRFPRFRQALRTSIHRQRQ